MFHVNGILQYVAFYIWLLSLGMIFSRFLHVRTYISMSFYGWIITASYAYTTFCLFIHQLMFDCFDYFHFGLLWITLLWTFMYQFLYGHMPFNTLWYMPRRGIAGSYGSSMSNCLRNGQTVFPSSCTILHSHQQYMRFLVSPHSQEYFLLSFLVGMKWYHLVILIQISLMTDDVEHIFMCLLAFCVSSLEKCPFKFFAYF